MSSLTLQHRREVRRKREDYSQVLDQAVPDKSMSLQVMLDRHNRGQLNSGTDKTPLHTSIEEMEFAIGINPMDLDLVEIQGMKNALKEQQERLKKDIKDKQSENLKRDQDRAEKLKIQQENHAKYKAFLESQQ